MRVRIIETLQFDIVGQSGGKDPVREKKRYHCILINIKDIVLGEEIPIPEVFCFGV